MYLEGAAQKKGTIHCNDTFVIRTSNATKLKVLELYVSQNIKAVAPICNACPELEVLKIDALPLESLNLPKLETLVVKDYQCHCLAPGQCCKWITQFPKLHCLQLLDDPSVAFSFYEKSFRPTLECLLHSSSIEELAFNTYWITPAIAIPNVTSLKIDVLGIDENANDDDCDYEDTWTSSNCIKFLRPHCKRIEKLFINWDCNRNLDNFMLFIAENCTNLELFSYSAIDMNVEFWKLFCQKRKESGNVQKKLQILTHFNLSSDLLLEANATTFGSSVKWSKHVF